MVSIRLWLRKDRGVQAPGPMVPNAHKIWFYANDVGKCYFKYTCHKCHLVGAWPPENRPGERVGWAAEFGAWDNRSLGLARMNV